MIPNLLPTLSCRSSFQEVDVAGKLLKPLQRGPCQHQVCHRYTQLADTAS